MSDTNLYEKDFFEKGAYDYARMLAFYYYGVYGGIDSDGKEYYTGVDEPGRRLYLDIREGKAIFPFTREQYDSNTDVQNSLAALGLDSEKFWHALLYAYYYAESKNTECVSLKPAVQEHVKAILKTLKSEGAIITIKGKDSKYTVSDPVAIDYIRDLLEQGDNANKDNSAYVDRRGRLLSRRDDISVIWQMADFYEAMCRVIEKYRTDKGLPTRVAGQVGSRDMNLLISRLLYVVRLTKSKAFLKDTNSIKGLKKYWRTTQRPLKASTYEWDHGDTISDSTDTDTDTDSGSDILSEATLYVPR